MKKKGITLSLIAILFTATFYGQLSNGLKAHYSFGGNANDISGQNNNGQLIGVPILTTDRFGTINCAYQFPGDTLNYIKVNYSSDFNIAPTGAFSISLWYQGGTNDVGDLEDLFFKNDPAITPIPSDYHLGLYDMNKPSFGSQYSPIVMPSNSPSIPDPNWHHVVAMYDNKKWYLYEDDVLSGADLSQTSTIFQSTGNISIGKSFLGKIDDIRFYNRVLSTNEIHQIYLLAGSCQVIGIEELTERTIINIYPNPTANIIHIESSNATSINVSVFDINGREIINQCLNKQNAIIDLSSFPNGLYFIKTMNDGIIQNRIIEKLN